jgi:RimJ/RimL family protein N-acetyltransferase
VILQTERLALHAFTLDDAPFVLELLNDPDFLRYIGDKGARDVDGARAYLEAGPLAGYARHGFGLWRVERRADGLNLGMCGLLKRDHLEHPDVGYAFLPVARGQGYALEAVAATVAYARAPLGLHEICAITTVDNQASIRVLERAGFSLARVMPANERDPELNLYTRSLT